MQTVFLACLVGGFLLSILLVLLGGVHGVGHMAGHQAGGHHAGGHAHHGGSGGHEGLDHSLIWALSLLSPLTISGFALLFGGVGLLAGGSILALPIALAAGLLGAILIRMLLRAFVDSSTEPLSLSGEGALGTINATIYPGRTGEVVYTLEGLHRSVAARTQTDAALPRGTTVVITRINNGIAWVEPIDPLDKGD